MLNTATVVSEQRSSALRSTLLRSKSDNPALQRLKKRHMENPSVSECITAGYSRMHHRHNRS